MDINFTLVFQNERQDVSFPCEKTFNDVIEKAKKLFDLNIEIELLLNGNFISLKNKICETEIIPNDEVFILLSERTKKFQRLKSKYTQLENLIMDSETYVEAILDLVKKHGNDEDKVIELLQFLAEDLLNRPF